MTTPLIVRREQPDDGPLVRAVHAEAFLRDDDVAAEPVEATLLDELRADPGWIPRLSLVAEIDGRVVGHVVCTRATVLPDTPVLGLGPLAVDPAHQRNGVGTALVHAVLGAADALDEPLVALLGSPLYYGRFGFVLASDVGIGAPEGLPADHFQVKTLSTHDPATTGTFRYASPFDHV